MGIEITPRCRYLRTLLSEYSRLVDHLTCIAAGLMELGAMTAFLYLVMVRDYMYEHLAALTGARVTYTLRPHRRARARPARRLARAPRGDPGPVRGVRRPRPRASWTATASSSTAARRRRDLDRRRAELRLHRPDPALDRACRATCARTRPTSPTPSSTSTCRSGIKGDNYDRYFVRMREMDESVYMMRQLAQMLPEGPINVDDRRCTFPEKHARLPRDRVADQPLQAGHGRARGAGRRGLLRARGAERRARLLHRLDRQRHAVQGARALAELRAHGRPRSRMLDGGQLADIVPTFGSINMIGGECDR